MDIIYYTGSVLFFESTINASFLIKRSLILLVVSGLVGLRELRVSHVLRFCFSVHIIIFV